jgi:hypothetical protein
MDKTNETITIDIEMQARMVEGHWRELTKANKWKFKREEEEAACKTLFIMGYQCAWKDACDVCAKACAMDELLAKQP